LAIIDMLCYTLVKLFNFLLHFSIFHCLLPYMVNRDVHIDFFYNLRVASLCKSLFTILMVARKLTSVFYLVKYLI